MYDVQKSRVVDGHTILQPRVGVSLNRAQQSRFVQLYAGEAGIDPYTRVVSDVYQDLFGEGSFIGKGIYEVDSFERCCSNFPENAILSHDLIEGAYCRSALVSDVTLYEEYPSRYLSDIGRRHRWIRGDWQIAGWLLPRVRNRAGQSVRNPISALSWWKIFDNLRRSLVSLTMLSLLLVTWFILPAMAASTMLFIACVVFLPTMLDFVTTLFHKPVDLPFRMHARETLQATGRPLGQNILTLVFLPFEAYICVDAITRTLVRINWTKRRLLEWKTASDSERGNTGSLSNTIYQMLVAPGIAASSALLLYIKDPVIFPWAAPWLAAWFVSPVVAWWLSRPIIRREIHFSESEQHFLEKLSRKTWRYFEEYVTKDDHWLPPDNIQQNPDLVLATRTSPTNIGMALLSNLSAYDFGYCSAAQFLTRTRNTLKTLDELERHHGHFYNWYDTRSLKPLHPQYISMVDSGNLAANLLILGSGCQELSEASILPRRMFAGLSDTLRVLCDVARRLDGKLVDAVFHRKIERQLEILDQAPVTLQAAHELLADLEMEAAELSEAADCDEELAWWARAYERSCQDHRADLLHLAVWLTLPEAPDGLFQSQSDDQSVEVDPLASALQHLDNTIGLRDVAKLQSTVVPLIQAVIKKSSPEYTDWLIQLGASLSIAAGRSAARIRGFEELALQSHDLADMDFGLLYDKSRDLFAIGYNVSERRLDPGFYDLLASEARLASFIVIAQGHFGQE
ncbi:MAG: cyclic beta 1-2 glucan synthetase, partial [Gimesia chilikensis]